jgi:hypothetical protein
MLRRHLTTAHSLSPADYRARWNLKATHPLTAPGYSDRRSTLAKQFDLGRSRPRQSAVAPDPSAPAPKRRGRPARQHRHQPDPIDTIDYVATDASGLAATSTRIVIIEAASTGQGSTATSTP